ncbi:hypothetical protein BJD12_23220 (plasmid) [Xanthomonas vesicatoria ATCC 35937]|uniref:Uncharacterized protein n=3 Tax=Xanthomonas TaxID=338 RepID=A0AAJ0N346_9XANT|nr:hypothetical protein BJD12_23220 [Xanthomonas vesicatoria ATCC 35937]APP87253.1 hypothetical protein BI317_24630 [Xanthomonas hortorum pv. gardneri]KGE50364.1 hypothetical protein GW15_0221630 [Xanthomonas axonopodis pv. vasculorum]KHM92607.1 hypothetical protein OR61_16225 [Xanthomonas vesicatoria]QYF47670.1 hypothetical protein HZS93_07228 [Xanthomonas citri]
MLRIPYPVPEEKRDDALQALAAGQPVSIGQASLHPDPAEEVIWGVDPYGMDCLLSAGGSGRSSCELAITWAESVHAGTHRAELTYDF